MVAVTLTHRDGYRFSQDLKLDKHGRAGLGPLKDVRYVEATGEKWNI